MRQGEVDQGSDARACDDYRLRYLELFEFASDAQLVTDLRGIIREANHAAVALLHCRKEFLIGKPLGLLLSAGVRSRFYECLMRLDCGVDTDEFEARIGRGGKNREVTVRVVATDVPETGLCTYRWEIRDITRLKREEAARTKLLLRLVTSQEDEHRRISREIHDVLGQEFTALKLGLKALEAEIPHNSAGWARLLELEETVDRLGRETHEMANDLRPTALDDLGLRAALESLVRRWSERTGVLAGFRFGPVGYSRFPAHVESAVYRIIQEALTNVAKHANASSVSVIVDHRDRHLMALVEDDGCGFDSGDDAPNGRLGLMGMYERVSLLGGSLQIESSLGAGTTIRARIPCEHRSEIGSDGEAPHFAGG
jgi:PAS domain S-box-containing protein